jgi:spore maturation protein CgeB
VRILIVDYYYPAFLKSFYASRPDLAGASFEEHRIALRSALFDALRSLGHEADDVIVNAYPIRQAWAGEHDLTIGPERRWQYRQRRGLIPWVSRLADGSWGWTTRQAKLPWFSPAPDGTWMWSTLLAQVRDYRPDVVHIACMDLVPSAVVANIATQVRLVVGQVATELPANRSYRDYGLVVSAVHSFVHRFRQGGASAEWLPLAFEPAIRRSMAELERDIAVSFVGSFSDRYADRAEIVAALAGAAPLQTWTADVHRLPLRSPIRKTIQGQAFGKDMYRLMARSRVTVNTHGIVAGNEAANLRLFEATGMGALLVTDARTNLGELFDVGAEVVAYENPHEAGELVRYYLDHPKDAQAVAAAGQARTLREHTWTNRMERLSRIIGERL